MTVRQESRQIFNNGGPYLEAPLSARSLEAPPLEAPRFSASPYCGTDTCQNPLSMSLA
jgi:hypothetical protein